MTSVDYCGVSQAADRRDDSPHATLELRRKLDSERARRVAYIPEATCARAVDRSKKQHVCSHLDGVALVHPAGAPGRLELQRDEGSPAFDLLLENVVRLAAKPEARVAKQDGRNDTGVGGDDRRPAAEGGSKSGGASVSPKDDKRHARQSRGYPCKDQ